MGDNDARPKEAFSTYFKKKLREICGQGVSTVSPVSKLVFNHISKKETDENKIKEPIEANRRRLNLSNSTVQRDHTT